MNGFLILDKPAGITSFSAANACKKIFNAKKTGHTGTLDPDATGVLPVALNYATGFISYIPTYKKIYRAKALLGMSTKTLDTSGEVVKTAEIPHITRIDVENALRKFLGKSMQIPPMYSAIKKNGKHLYELARKNLYIEREAKEIEIFDISLDDFDLPYFTFTVSCSKGTYIRSLIDDLGKSLGTISCMAELRRLSTDGFNIDETVNLYELSEMEESEKFERIVPIESVFSFLKKIIITDNQVVRIQNGGEISAERLKYSINNDEIYSVFDNKATFLGLAKAKKNALYPEKIIPKIYL